MFIKIVIIFAIFLSAFIVKAEENKDSIKVEYAFFGNSFFIDGKEYSRSEIKNLLSNDPLTSELISSSSLKRTFGFIALPAGIILSGKSIYEIYRSYYRRSSFNLSYIDISIYIPIAAICLDITSIILISNGNKSFYGAIRKYNKNISTETNSSLFELDFQFGINRLGLTLNF